MLYDPAKSETFRALQEEGLGDVVQEVPTPVQTKVFTAPANKVRYGTCDSNVLTLIPMINNHFKLFSVKIKPFLRACYNLSV